MTVETMLIDKLVTQTWSGVSGVVGAAIADVPAGWQTEIKWALHCALREIIERTEHAAFRTRAVVNLAAATTTYPLPDDFHRMIEEGVKFGTTDFRTLEYISEQDWDAKMLDANTTQTDPWLYTVLGRKSTTGAAQIKFWPTPGSIRQVSVHYLAFPIKVHDMVNGTSIDARIPPEYHHILVTGALRHLPRYISDSDWQKANGLWEVYVAEARKKSVQVTGQTYQKELYSSGLGAFGLGRVPATLTGPSL
jgi:hypothetical protein